jgi:hypothetical protein
LAGGEEMKPAQWDNLQARIRSTLSMEQERELFDLLSGTAADAKPVKAKDEEGKIELF